MTDHKTLKVNFILLSLYALEILRVYLSCVQEFKKHSKYLVHDPEEACVIGDQVQVNSLSLSRFTLLSVLSLTWLAIRLDP